MPDSTYPGRHSFLFVLTEDDVRLDPERLEFNPRHRVWRPDYISIAQSYIYLLCQHRDIRDRERTMWISAWLSEFILFTLCEVSYLPKCETENEV